MTNFFVPACGSVFELTKPWEAEILLTFPNTSFFKKVDKIATNFKWKKVNFRYHPYYSLRKLGIEDAEKYETGHSHSTATMKINAAMMVSFMPGDKFMVEKVYIRNIGAAGGDCINISLLKTSNPFLLSKGFKTDGSLRKKLCRISVRPESFNKIKATMIECSYNKPYI